MAAKDPTTLAFYATEAEAYANRQRGVGDARLDPFLATLPAGAAIHEYQPTMYHAKIMIVDGQWVSVGSTNFDNRSFSINDEANLNVYDAAFARDQIEVFERDLALSRRVTLEEWRSRAWLDKALDFGASLLSSQL